ncbi:hypothetical protein MTO96_020189 [Rhipicephalus appendiculatus]
MDCSVEIRPSLGICKLQALVWNFQNGPITGEVDCSSSKLKIVVKENDAATIQTELAFSDNVAFKADRLSVVQGHEVLRDRERFAQPVPCRELTFNMFCEKAEPEPKLQHLVESALVAGTQYCFKCGSCFAEILDEDASFRRVLPLPSENWREAAGEWFCHKHESTTGSDIPRVLEPKSDELFTSTTHVIVHNARVCGADLDRGDGRLRCAQCGVVLGRKATDSSAALFTTRVTVTPVDEEDGNTVGGADASSILRALIKERLELNTTCRLVVTSGKQVLLLWLMETGLHHFHSKDVQSRQVVVHLRVGSKLLYLKTDDSDAVVATWKQDPLVGEYQLEPEVMEDTVDYLNTHCNTMGATFERFRVIFLPGAVAQR